MRFQFRFLPSLPYHMAYDGEGEGEGDGEGGGEGGGGSGGGGSEGGGEGGGGAGGGDANKKRKTPPTFSKEQQEYFNAQMAEERRKGKEKNDQLIVQLEAQRTRAGTSEAEKKQIEDRIEQLRGEYATKEEQAKKTMEVQLKTERDARLKAEQVAKDWENLYTEERLDGDLTHAAVELEAFNPEPVKAVLRPRTRLVPELDAEGKPTGKKTTRVRFEKPGEDGKIQILEMTPKEAVKHLKDQPDIYGNLFISKASGGLGGHNFNGGAGGGGKGKNTPPTDQAEYREWRKKEKAAGRL